MKAVLVPWYSIIRKFYCANTNVAIPYYVYYCRYLRSLFQCITSAAVYYADLTHQKLQDTGYYEDTAPFRISDEVCVWPGFLHLFVYFHLLGYFWIMRLKLCINNMLEVLWVSGRIDLISSLPFEPLTLWISCSNHLLGPLQQWFHKFLPSVVMYMELQTVL